MELKDLKEGQYCRSDRYDQGWAVHCNTYMERRFIKDGKVGIVVHPKNSEWGESDFYLCDIDGNRLKITFLDWLRQNHHDSVQPYLDACTSLSEVTEYSADKFICVGIDNWEETSEGFDHWGSIEDSWCYYLGTLDYIPQFGDPTECNEEEMSEKYLQPLKYGTTSVAAATAVVNNQSTKKEEETMIKLKDTTSNLVNQNKEAALLAAKIAAGKALNKKATNLIKPQLPMMVRGYADHAMAPVIFANMFAFAIKHYMPTNDKANLAADTMVSAASFQAMDAFDIEGMLDGFLDGISIPGVEEEPAKKKPGRPAKS